MPAAFRPGDIIHGFAGGAFGRDSYACRRVIVAGPDFLVTRNDRGAVEFCSGNRIPTKDEACDRGHCPDDCIERLAAVDSGVDVQDFR
ncbi:hypothetical protein ACFY36_50680 [Actinoplanes sp. NPDC000266]